MAPYPSVPFDYRKVDAWINELEEDNELKWILREFMKKFRELDEEVSSLKAVKKA
jgi:uncharacterized protein involved in tolerance to divalent cations